MTHLTNQPVSTLGSRTQGRTSLAAWSISTHSIGALGRNSTSIQGSRALDRNQPSPQNGRQGTSNQGTATLDRNHPSNQGTTLAGYLKTRNPRDQSTGVSDNPVGKPTLQPTGAY